MDPKALDDVRAAYDTVAPAHAAQLLDELASKPFDRALPRIAARTPTA